MNTIATLLSQAISVLSSCSSSATLDAYLLLEKVLKKDRLQLILMCQEKVPVEQEAEFLKLLTKRAQGVPIAYLIGKKAFWTFDLFVNENTLIPRPETELLVETALALFPSSSALKVADLGTGSGAIALALAKEKPAWEVWAVDQSESALEIAKKNAQHYQVENIHFLKSDWFQNLKDFKFDLIISNPPYLAEDDVHLSTEIRYEPYAALVAAEEGMADLYNIILTAKYFLREKGWLIVEHGFTQASIVRVKMQEQGYQTVHSLCDLAGHERVTLGCMAAIDNLLSSIQDSKV